MEKTCIDCKDRFEWNPQLIKLRPITQDFCDSCYQKLLDSPSKREFLNKISSSVLAYDNKAIVKIANEHAKIDLGKGSEQLLDKMGGEVVDCVYVTHGKGCGTAPNCKECTVREYLLRTRDTGEGFYEIKANQILKSATGLMQFDFKFSVEKLQDLVLFRIDKRV